MVYPQQTGPHSILKGIENWQMPDVQAIGDQSYPAERCPLEEAFEYTGIKENDQDETTIDQRETKLVDPANGLEQARKCRPGIQVDIGIVTHGHEQESQHTDAPQPRTNLLYAARVFPPGGGVIHIGITEDQQHADGKIFQVFAIDAIYEEEDDIEQRARHQEC